MLYAYKILDIEAETEVERQIVDEYKSGNMDPINQTKIFKEDKEMA